MSDYESNIKITVEDSALTSTEKRINNLKNKTVDVKVNDTGTSKVTKDLEKVTQSTQTVRTEASKTGSTLQSAFANAAVYKGIQLTTEGLKEMVSIVKSINDAAVDLQMATNQSLTETMQLMRSYNSMAQDLGATTTEISSAANDYLRQGKSIAETNTLITDSMVLSKVAKLESESATEYLTAISKGYKKTVEEVSSINDALTSIDMAAAVDAAGLAEATSRTAAVASSAGIELNKLLGIEAAIGEASQEDMSVIGNSMKTILTRMSDIKSGNLELIDEDGTLQTLSDVETVLNNIMGISLRDSANEFRNFGDVLDEMAVKWSSLSSVQESAVSKAFAGTRQVNRFKLLMENYNKALQYEEIANTSSGMALEKFENYTNSLGAKQKSLYASFESLATNTFSEEFMGDILDMSKSVVDLADDLGLLKGAIAGISTKALLEFGSFVNSKWGNITEFIKSPTTLASASVAAIVSLYQAYQNYKQSLIETATEATSAWESTKTSLQDYATQYEELKNKLDSGELSEAETLSVKKEILDIQSQITSQYGDQVSGIDLVNGKLETQLGILQNISQEEANKNLNENQASYDNAKKEMLASRSYQIGALAPLNENATDQYNLANEKIREIAKEFEDLGIELRDNGYETTIYFEGDASKAEEVINEFETRVRNMDTNIYGEENDAINSIIKWSSEALTRNKEILDTHRDNYKSYLEQSLYAQGDANILFDYAEAIEEYNTALASGDNSKIAETKVAFDEAADAKDKFLKADGNAQYADMFEEITEQIDNATIKYLDFKEATTGFADKDNIFKEQSKDIKSCADDIKEFELTSTDALDALMNEGRDASESIWELAEAWGVVKDDYTQEELQAFIDALVDMDVISEDATGSLENLNEAIDKVTSKGSIFDQLEGNLDSRKLLDAIEAADETANAGDDYVSADKYLDEAKEMYDKGLIGTDDFKARAVYFSPTGSDDPANFIENYKKASKYLTEDAKGVQRFLQDLSEKTNEAGDAMASYNKKTGEWSYHVDDFEYAAQQMGVSTEFLLDMFGRLEDYGFSNNFATSVSDAADKIIDKSAELATAKAKLAEMESTGFYTTIDGNGNEVKTAANQTAITAQREEVAALENDLKQLQALKEEYARRDAESYAEQVRNSKETYQTLLEERNRILKENTYGDDTETVAKLMEAQLKQIASDNMLEVDAELNLVNTDEVKDEIEDEVTPDPIPVEVQMGVGNEEDVTTLGNRLSSLSETYNPKVIIDVENGSQIDNVVSQLANIPADTNANLSFNVQNEEQAVELETKIDNLKKESGSTFTYEVNVIGDENVPDDTTVKTVKAVVEGAEDVEVLNEEIGKVKDKTAKVKADVLGLTDVIKISDEIKELPMSKTVTIHTVVQGDKVPEVTGTMLSPARASGTAYNVINTVPAYANGKVSLSKDETALVNELGTESIIRDGRWFLIPGGMHTENLKKGDIILSAEQTKQLLNYGKASGHGHAYADGSIANAYAYPSGSGGGSFGVGGSGSKSGLSLSGKNGNDNGNNSSNGNKDTDDFKEDLNWIEIALSRIQRFITNVGKTVQATFKSWSTRNKAISDEVSKINEEISLQQQAYEKYMELAEGVGLSDHYKQLVQNGAIAYETITDEALNEKIQEYQDFYERALDCSDAVIDLKDNLVDLAVQKFDNVFSEYDDQLSLIEHRIEMIEGTIDKIEESGHVVNESYYNDLIVQENQNLTTLKKELATLNTALTEVETSGVGKYSEEWYDLYADIMDVEGAILDAETALVEYNNALRQLEWDAFDRMLESMSAINSETEFLEELLSDNELFNKNGTYNDYGQAVQGLNAVDLNAYEKQLQKVSAELLEIQELRKEDPENLNIIERENELIEKQRDLILSMEDTEQEMIDLERERCDTLLSYMDELISKRKDELQLITDQRDFQKTIAEQSKTVAELEKIKLAIQGDDSESNRALLQQTEVELEEARANLEETMYDKYISDQEKLLDSLYDETEEFINALFEDQNSILHKIIDSADINSENIIQTLKTEASSVGTTLSDALKQVLSTDDNASNLLTEPLYKFGAVDTKIRDIMTAKSSDSDTIDNLIKATVESGFVLARADESFINEEQMRKLRSTSFVAQPLVDGLRYVSPNVVRTTSANNVNIHIGEIPMYGVNDPKEFSRQLVYALKNDKKVTNVLHADILGTALGKNSLTKHVY